MNSDKQTIILILMGVSGSGKSTIGSKLAQELGWTFYDGDDYHPQKNIEKMSNGDPLTDEDREPWLDNLRELIDQHLAANEPMIMACSALKARYRKHLKQSDDRVIFVFLDGEFDLIWSRMASRENHYMKADMLKSQFNALETPDADEAHIISINQSAKQIITEIKARIYSKPS